MKLQGRIFYELTHVCNLRCIHCCNSSRNDLELLTSSEIEKFHQLASCSGFLDSVLTGGEPTMHSEFFDIVDILSKYGNVTITTNGTYLSEKEYLSILEKYPNVLLQVSLDGFSEKTNDNIRGLGTFDKVMKLVEKVVDNKKNSQLCLSCVITKENIGEIMDLVRFVKNNSLNSIYFPRLVSSGRGHENWYTIAPTIENEKEIEMSLIEEISNDSTDSILLNRLDHIMTAILGEISNKQCIFSIKISPNGEIYPCPLSTGAMNCIGDIFSCDSFEEIINKLAQMQENQYDSYYIEKHCTNCEVNIYCKKNFCEICKFNLASDCITEEEKMYQCEINKFFYLKMKEEVE